MILLGLTGGVASGKSTVAAMFAQRGAAVLDADRFAHEALDSVEVRRALVEHFGPEVIDSSGRVARRAIAERVFGDDPRSASERKFLEGIVHPLVRTRLREGLRIAEESGVHAVVLDVPLLLEAGWADECDAVLLIDTSESVRLERAAARGWDAAELARREASQWPIERKRAASTAVIRGDSLAEAEAGVTLAWERFVASAGGGGEHPPGGA